MDHPRIIPVSNVGALGGASHLPKLQLGHDELSRAGSDLVASSAAMSVKNRNFGPNRGKSSHDTDFGPFDESFIF
jgi:hypothetical protein